MSAWTLYWIQLSGRVITNWFEYTACKNGEWQIKQPSRERKALIASCPLTGYYKMMTNSTSYTGNFPRHLNRALEQINSRSYLKSQRSQKIKIILASPVRLEDNCFYEKWNLMIFKDFKNKLKALPALELWSYIDLVV